MIFVDTNVFMYAVGRPHAFKQPARDFFTEAQQSHMPLCTSAEVLQELAHAYFPPGGRAYSMRHWRWCPASVSKFGLWKRLMWNWPDGSMSFTPHFKPGIFVTWRVVDAVGSEK